MVKSWDISEADFPYEGTLTQKIEFCLRYAILAPSTYNNQPWYFVVEDDRVSVYADRRYALPVVDPDDRQLIMSCGVVLFYLRLALRYFGLQEQAQLLPNPADENLIAHVQVVGQQEDISEEDTTLFRAIAKRHTNRSAFKKTEVPEEALNALRAAAIDQDAWLHVCEGDERDVVAHFVAEGDQLQMGNKAFRRELAVWANERRFVSGDGYPDYARSFTELMSSNAPCVLRRFETGPGRVVRDNEIAKHCPVIAVLGGHKGGLADRIYTGQAFARVVLQAEALGLSVSTLNQPCEVPELRLRLHDELPDAFARAQYVLRIGYADPVVNLNPRRPVETFIERPDDHGHRSHNTGHYVTVSHGGKSKGFFSAIFAFFAGLFKRG